MALGADLHPDVGLGRAGADDLPARTSDHRVHVFRMNAHLHDSILPGAPNITSPLQKTQSTQHLGPRPKYATGGQAASLRTATQPTGLRPPTPNGPSPADAQGAPSSKSASLAEKPTSPCPPCEDEPPPNGFSTRVRSARFERGLSPRNPCLGEGRKEHAARRATTARRGRSPRP